jgi:uncharacterized protein YbjT (DUF2867 family)
MSKPIIAIAGGSSALGRGIVEALLNNDVFTPVVLSREGSATPQWLKDLGVEIRRVDYLSLDSCTQALSGVHTVSLAEQIGLILE